MSGVPSRLEIRLLGPVDVRVDSSPFDVDTRKATALLAYLAVSRREQSRDRLADLFWPDTGAERARAALWRTLSALRSGLGGRWVEADRSVVCLVGDDTLFCDVDVILASLERSHDYEADERCHACLDSLSSASELVRGDFMEGFVIRGCPDFDDWLMVESERLRRRLSVVFERLSGIQASFGRYPEAIESARCRLEVDLLAEDAHRRLMLLHARSDDRSASSEAYRACESVLNREHGTARGHPRGRPAEGARCTGAAEVRIARARRLSAGGQGRRNRDHPVCDPRRCRRGSRGRRAGCREDPSPGGTRRHGGGVRRADGLITVNQPHEKLREVIAAFREGGGEDKPAYLKVHLSWAEDDDTALKIAHEQWRTNVFDSRLAWNLETPGQFEAAARFVRPDDVVGSVLISSDFRRHIEWLNELAALGFDGLYLHHVGQEQGPFIEAFGAEVLPAVAS